MDLVEEKERKKDLHFDDLRGLSIGIHMTHERMRIQPFEFDEVK